MKTTKMKQRSMVISLILAVLFVLSSCGKPSDVEADPSTEPEQPVTSLPAETESPSEAPEQLSDGDAFALWQQANTAYATLLLPVMAADSEENADYSDPDTGMYYKLVDVEEINGKEDLASYLSRFFEPEVYSALLSGQEYLYRENDGRLYIQIGGMGDSGLTATAFRLKSQDGDTATVELTYFDEFEQTDGTMEQTLRRTDGVWRFYGDFYCFYDDLSYDGIQHGT